MSANSIFPFAQNIWDLHPPVSVEFRRGRHEKAWASPNTLARILACVLRSKAARMARCALLARVLHAEKTRRAPRRPSAHTKTAKTKKRRAYRAFITVPFRAEIGSWINDLGRSKVSVTNQGGRLTEPFLRFSITPHQFQKAKCIAQWPNLADLIGINSGDRD